ncbi:hypothetical protein BN189_1150001 [Clostridioides difficile T10]|nr:hypothetical protein BN186_2590001 [Clostridioides difficile E23]CCL86466.1 hypothetical protein BN189_1150001 [Clostridioides difficile T10]
MSLNVNDFINIKFTYHIVNIKHKEKGYISDDFKVFTYHIVNIKPQNKLSIFNIYTYTTLSNLQ